jgi:hypothetical protein
MFADAFPLEMRTMKTVWKFPVLREPEFAISMPRGALLLSFQDQHGQLCLWAAVDPAEPMELRRFRLAGTGHPIAGGVYVGTAQQGEFVWHLFLVRG